MLQMDTGKFSVYCNMDGAGLGDCGGGGWTLVMKIDGSKVDLKRLFLPRELNIVQQRKLQKKFINSNTQPYNAYC